MQQKEFRHKRNKGEYAEHLTKKKFNNPKTSSYCINHWEYLAINKDIATMEN